MKSAGLGLFHRFHGQLNGHKGHFLAQNGGNAGEIDGGMGGLGGSVLGGGGGGLRRKRCGQRCFGKGSRCQRRRLRQRARERRMHTN